MAVPRIGATVAGLGLAVAAVTTGWSAAPAAPSRHPAGGATLAADSAPAAPAAHHAAGHHAAAHRHAVGHRQTAARPARHAAGAPSARPAATTGSRPQPAAVRHSAPAHAAAAPARLAAAPAHRTPRAAHRPAPANPTPRTGGHHAAPAAPDDTTAAATAPGWLSGASTGDITGFEQWLGHAVGVYSLWTGRESWQTLSDIGWLPDSASYPGTLSIGLAMLPDDTSATLADCADGDYDSYYATMGSTLTQLGRGDSFLRLGWEFNGDWYRWSIADATPSVWISCWRHEVAALRSTDPQARIVWNANAQSSGEVYGSALSYYPGDQWVDVVGVDYYDHWPAMTDAQIWDQQYDKTEPDGMPEGIGAWLQFAQAHGKQLAVPEWGVDDGSGGGGDDPYYVEAMHRFFADNASQIAYEAYFDEWSECSISGLLGGTAFPQSAAKYRALWDTTAAGGSGSSGSGSGSGSGSSGSGSPGSGSSGSGSGSSGGHRPGKVSLPRHHGWRWLAGHGRGNGSSGARVRRVRGWGHRAEAHHRRFRPYAHWHRVNRRHHRQGRRRRR